MAAPKSAAATTIQRPYSNPSFFGNTQAPNQLFRSSSLPPNVSQSVETRPSGSPSKSSLASHITFFGNYS